MAHRRAAVLLFLVATLGVVVARELTGSNAGRQLQQVRPRSSTYSASHCGAWVLGHSLLGSQELLLWGHNHRPRMSEWNLSNLNSLKRDSKRQLTCYRACSMNQAAILSNPRAWPLAKQPTVNPPTTLT
jgi:hypothetical protein